MELKLVNDVNNTKNKFTFTNGQKKAIDTLIDFIAAPFTPSKYTAALIGCGGTGKTFITKFIINNCKYSNTNIRCTSSTHKACRVFSQAIGNREVYTIQSTFGLRLDLKLEDFDPNNPQFNPSGRHKLENVKLLFIDEASMIPAKLVTYICKVCKKAEIKVIFIGDDYQLAPVNENKSIAFSMCPIVCKLTEIVRQGEGNPIIDLADLLRYDIQHGTYRFLQYIYQHMNTANLNSNNEGFVICNKADFVKSIDTSFANEEYTRNIDMYRVIAYTNDCVSTWNTYIRNSIIKDCDKNVITKHDLIMSYETIVDEFMSIILNNSEEYIIKDIIDYVDDAYGFKGFLIKFQLIHGGLITKPLFVIDHLDKFTILKYNQILTELINSAKVAKPQFRASKWREYFEFKKKYLIIANIKNRNGNILFSRDLDYGFAITAHKSQGSTYENVFVDVNDMIYTPNGIMYTNKDDLLRRLYVACSRARKKLVLCYGN